MSPWTIFGLLVIFAFALVGAIATIQIINSPGFH